MRIQREPRSALPLSTTAADLPPLPIAIVERLVNIDRGPYRCHWGEWDVGTYLSPALIARGHKVLKVSRGTGSPYREHAASKAVEQVRMDRKPEEKEGRFGARWRS
jgi:hypothetical protein